MITDYEASYVGFTGSRGEPTPDQRRAFLGVLDHFDTVRPPWADLWFHHGDCVGADYYAGSVVYERGGLVVLHPPSDPKYRAFSQVDLLLDPAPYLERNRSIVNATGLLIAMPDGPERRRSGTWSTVRYALSLGRHTIIIDPTGSTVSHPARNVSVSNKTKET